MVRPLCIALLLTAVGCSSETDPPVATGPDTAADLSALGGDRPVVPMVPEGFDPSVPTPLVVFLHGYGASGLANDIILKLDEMVDERGFIYLRPDGTFDGDDHRFWNATDGCCNFEGVELDDVGYMQGLIDEAKARYTIDHVAFIGHSNGGFMSHRFACDAASSVDAFASLAGAAWLDAARCQPEEPVRMLQMHGTADDTVAYDGGNIDGDSIGGGAGLGSLPPHPGAVESVAQWAAHNGCDPTPASAGERDYSPDSDGAETKVMRHAGCVDGGAAELWTLEGEGHLPNVNDAWRDDVLDFLLQR